LGFFFSNGCGGVSNQKLLRVITCKERIARCHEMARNSSHLTIDTHHPHGHLLASVPSAHWEGKAIRSFLTAIASAVALCGCAAQPMYWAKPDTSQITFKQRWESSSQATFKQRWPKISGETPHPRRGKKDREAARLAQGLNGLDW